MVAAVATEFAVIPAAPDAAVEWFATKEQAELYAAATGGKVATDLHAVTSHDLRAHLRRQFREAASKYIEQMLDTSPKP